MFRVRRAKVIRFVGLAISSLGQGGADVCRRSADALQGPNFVRIDRKYDAPHVLNCRGSCWLISREEEDDVVPAGVACNFDLGVDSVGEQPVYREFEDKDGNLRVLNAGKGVELTFTNLDTGATLALKPDGSVSQIKFNPDGSSTAVLTGHNVIILFPTDEPAGPSTIQYVGRVVITIDLDEVFTVQSVRGTSTDICASLS